MLPQKIFKYPFKTRHYIISEQPLVSQTRAHQAIQWMIQMVWILHTCVHQSIFEMLSKLHICSLFYQTLEVKAI